MYITNICLNIKYVTRYFNIFKGYIFIYNETIFMHMNVDHFKNILATYGV